MDMEEIERLQAAVREKAECIENQQQEILKLKDLLATIHGDIGNMYRDLTLALEVDEDE